MNKASDETRRNKVYIVGHKNPDTDSICSAIAYANLKRQITGGEYTARRAGNLNEETLYVLDTFQVEVPPLLTNVQVQVKDMERLGIEGIRDQISIKEAWQRMKELNIKTLPILRDKKLEGVITVGDIATSYMDVYDNRALATARTQYRNIVSALEGEMITGNAHAYFNEGKVAIAASDSDSMEGFIEKGDLVLVGNRYEAQRCALELNVSCLVICNSMEVSDAIKDMAEERSIVVIRTHHDTYTAARLINQSIPVKHFMSKGNLTTFHANDYVEDIKEVMAKKRFRDFPVVDRKGHFLGFISRRRLMGARKKQIILMDHNEKGQAVDGIEEAEILEIIDHHRLGTMETVGPVYFRNQPVGCTSTIVYQMYQEHQAEIDPTIASLLCAAIVSDTLLFRSPTCTAVDEAAARNLAEIAGLDLTELANNMFRAGSSFKDKTPEEIILQDFKQFSVEDITIGVGQINSLNQEELLEVKEQVLPVMEKVAQDYKLNGVYLMLTDIIHESTELLCFGNRAKERMVTAFELPEDTRNVILKGVVSRKKQLLPTFIGSLQQ